MTPEANWYPDPEGGGLRWWDGTAWTEDRKEAPAPPALHPIDVPVPIDPGPPSASPKTETGATEATRPSSGAPPASASWPPAADEKSFDERAAANSEQSPTPGIDPADQEWYRRLGADPGIWTRPAEVPPPAHVRVFREAEAEVAARQRTKPMSRGGKVMSLVIVLFLVGLLISIFDGGSSDSSSKGSVTPAAAKEETYEEQYEAAHDAVCEHAPWKYEAECQ